MLDPLHPFVKFVLPTILGLAAGTALGAYFSRRGVRAKEALVGRQLHAWVVVGAAGALAWSIYSGVLPDALPAAFQPYSDLALPPGATLLAGFVLGFIPVLERAAWREPEQRRPLLIGSGVSLALLAYLGWLALPVRPTEDLSADGVVFQTTPFTCAAASVATVARLTGASPGLTEGAAAKLAGSSFGGTFVVGEMRALRRVGLSAKYGRGLSMDDLIRHGGPGILHVDEPLPGGRRIRHAVALVSIDTVTRTVTVGNPLEGLQEIQFDAFDSYWIGEAILVAPRQD